MPYETYAVWNLVGIYEGFSDVEETPVGTFSSEAEATAELDWARRTWGHKYTRFEVRCVEYREWEE